MKLSDYGLEPKWFSTNINKSMMYEAPEVFNGKRDSKSDVCSLGVTLITMTKMDNPLKCLALSKADYQCCNRDSPSLSSEKWSDECVDFVGKCLVKDVKERWSVKQLMEVGDWEMV